MAIQKPKPVTVLLVDDQALMRKGLRALLASEADIDVIGEAADGQAAIDQVKVLAPDLVVMDIGLPKIDGIEATRQIRFEAPATKIVALSMHSEKHFVDSMLAAGASAYLLKDSAPEDLLDAIHAALRGEAFLSAPVLNQVVSGYSADNSSEQQAGDRAAATEPVLMTKLHCPPLPSDLVPRTALLERLEAGRNRPLTLVSAPAGYGKSVLLSSWLASSDWRGAWVSLDTDDSDLRRFLSYFLAAIHSVFPDACREIMGLLRAVDLPSVNRLAAILNHELNEITEPFILVLDDYHRISPTSSVNELIEIMLDRPAIPLHLAILSRRDPPLPLVSLRARGQLSELRMADLRFSPQETQTLLLKTEGFKVGDEGLAQIERVVEGWVVGLRLMSLALRQVEDREHLLAKLHTGVWQTQEYLIQEVVARQPADLSDWLLKSAILDRFCAPLCDAVCGEAAAAESDLDGWAFLRGLQTGNLFAIALDVRGEWWRYHHLFQELLQHELTQRLGAEKIADLHRRASRWFEAHEVIDQAIRHALAAGDDQTALEIVERHRNAQLNADNWYVVESWIEMLPPTQQMQSPDLLLSKAWIAYERFQIWALPAILDRVAEHLDEQTKETALWGELRLLQGEVFYWSGNGKQAHTCFAEARLRLNEDLPLYAGLLELQDALSLHMCGHTKQAIVALNRRVQEAFNKQGVYFSRLVAGLFFAHLMSGDLHYARSAAVHLESVATAGNIQYTKAWSSYMRACTFLHRHELEQAARHFEVAVEQRYILHRIAAVESLAGLALTQELMGQRDRARQTTQLLMNFAAELSDPAYLSIAQSSQARLALLQGDLELAGKWAGIVSDPPPSAELFMWLEVPALCRARVWIAQGSDASLKRASGLLDKIIKDCQAWHFSNQIIEAGALQSLALEKLGRTKAAAERMAETLYLVAPGGWVRPFVELGEPMAAIFRRLAAPEQGLTDQIQGILYSFRVSAKSRTDVRADQAHATPQGGARLEEPLTNREIDVLKLLAQRLQNKEIAARLFVSPETVKAHLKHLYQKLGVNNRREAAARAAEILPELHGA